MKVAKYIFILLVFVSTVSFAQEKPVKIKKNVEYKSASGLKYTFHKINMKAEMPAVGDMVYVHYQGTLTDGKEFDASYKRGKPFNFKLGQGQVIKGWDEGIALLHEGDSATLVIPANLGYGERQTGSIPSNSTLIFKVKLVKIEKPIGPYQVAGLDTNKLKDGLKYIVVKKGTGITAKIDNKVKVHYSGYLLEGKKFDASYDHPGAEPFDFIIGRNMVIEGWEKGVEGMKVGEKRRLIIPSKLAYGEEGRMPVIPPNSDLIFDVELMEIEIVPPLTFYDTKGLDTITTASGLQIIKVRTMKGRRTQVGDTIVVKYTGFFRDGKIFDSSYERNDSIVLLAGKKQVIAGWDEALLLLNEGEKARIIIPYKLAYGENGRPPVIPAKSDLLFDVHLVRNRNSE